MNKSKRLLCLCQWEVVGGGGVGGAGVGGDVDDDDGDSGSGDDDGRMEGVNESQIIIILGKQVERHHRQ